MDKVLIQALLGIINKGVWQMSAQDARHFTTIVKNAEDYLEEEQQEEPEDDL